MQLTGRYGANCCMYSLASMRQLSMHHLLAQLCSLILNVTLTTIFFILLALCLRLPILQYARTLRAVCGMALAAALMVISPLTYRREGQHMGICLATLTYMAALSMFDWCLLQPTDATPSIRQIFESFVWQPMSGVISAHQQVSRSIHSRSISREMSAAGNCSQKAPAEERRHQLSRKQLLQEAALPMLRVMLLIDVLSAVLECFLCYGNVSLLIFKQSPSNDLQTGPLAFNAAVVPPEAANALLTPSRSAYSSSASPLQYALSLSNFIPLAVLPYLSHSIVRFFTTIVAGFLLGLQLEFTYMTGRLLLIFVGYPNPGPVYMFNKPWLATSVTDLWSNRWHQVLRYYFTGLGYKLADRLTGGVVAAVDRLQVGMYWLQSRHVMGYCYRSGNSNGTQGSSSSNRNGDGSSSGTKARREPSESCGAAAKKGGEDVSGSCISKAGVNGGSAAGYDDAAGNHTAAVSDQSAAANPAAQQEAQMQQQQQQPDAMKPAAATPAAWQQRLRRIIRTLVAFAISGLVHEYVCWGAFGVVTGQQMLFFMLHGVAVVVEALGKQLWQQQQQGHKTLQNTPDVAKRTPGASAVGSFAAVPVRSLLLLLGGSVAADSSMHSQQALWSTKALSRLWVVMFSACTAPLFINVYLRFWHFQSYVPPFLVPITASLLQRVGLCNCW